jgi:CHAT domain-containing protein
LRRGGGFCNVSCGLSGLAKAFFYAGSRALLVSQCPVESDAVVALTTRMLALSGKDVIRAEAHRMAMIDTGPTHNSHPALWASVVVVVVKKGSGLLRYL